MASRIKGITVEIGGDTTGLDKALKGVNNTIKTTQTNLKDVNRLLKLDPGNTTLVSQKQTELKTAVGATKEKLEALKVAQEQAKKQLEAGTLGQEKYDALQREIVETEQELLKLQQQAATTSKTLEKMDAVGTKMEAVGGSMTAAGKKMLGVTAVVGGLGAAAVKTTAEFDTSMAKVSAVSGATGEDLQALRDKAREMGAKTKFSASEAADAMNYMAMAGWKTSDMLGGIDGIMNLAAASGEDLATTSDIVTDALTAFGMSAEESGHFADVLAAASSNANTNVSMLGESFKYAAPVAGALGITAEDTSIALGLMANAGIKASQGGTALRTGLTNLAKPTKQMKGYMDKYNIALVTNKDGSVDLRKTMISLREKMSGLNETQQAAAASAIFGKNSMAGWLAIINSSDSDFDKLTAAIDNCDGSALTMAETMQDNLMGQITILKSQLQELAISFGEILMPVVRKIVSALQSFIDKLNGMDEGTKKTIIKIALLAASIGPALIAIGTVVSKVGTALKAFSSMGKAMKLLSFNFKNGIGLVGKLGAALGGSLGPILAVVAVIAVLVAAFKHLWDTNEEFRNKITAIWDGIKAKFQEFGQTITDKLNSLGFNFKNFGEVIKAIWDGFCNYLAPIFTGSFQQISNYLSYALDFLSSAFDVFAGIFTGDWSRVWDGVKGIFSAVWELIKSTFTTHINTIKQVADVVLGWFGTNWESVWSAVKGFFVKIWNGIKSFFTNTWNGIKNTVSTVLGAIKSVIVTVWTAVKTKIATVLAGIKTAITTAWSAVKSAVSNTLNGIKSVVSTVWNAVKSTVSNVVSGIKSTVSNTFTALKSTVSSVFNGIKSAIITPITNAKNKVQSIVNAIKGFFSNMKISLPHIKLPHFSVTGKLSISPPSVPKLSISWYKEGGIMTNPTLFGINGASLLAGGEAGAEAILPLRGFYAKLEAMLDSKLHGGKSEQYLALIAKNSEKGIFLSDGTLVGHLLPALDSRLGQSEKMQRRLTL